MAVVVSLCAMLAFVVSGGGVARAAELPAAPVTGYAVAQAPVQVELQISPPVTTPGEQIDVILTATNNTSNNVTQTVLIPVPDGLTLTTGILPAGTSFDLTTRTVTWQPFLGGNSSQHRILLRFAVGPAEMQEPVRTFSVYVNPERGESPLSATYWVGLPPSVDILVEPAQPAVGQPVQLFAKAQGSGPLAQVWETGDGRRLEATDPVVVYPVAGTYEVRVRVANPLAAATAIASVSVLAAPEAAFTPDDASPAIDQTVRFVNHSGGQPPLSYLWDFGDGVSSNEREPMHAFRTRGDYRVSLTVQSATGQDTFVWPLTVGTPPSLRAEIPGTADAGAEILAQAFVDDSVTAVHWDMGDGHEYEGSIVRHTYALGGDRTVVVRAESPFGTSEVRQTIDIRSDTTRAVFIPLLVFPVVSSGQLTPEQAPAQSNVTAIASERRYEAFEPVVLAPAPLSEDASEAEQLFWYINEARRLHGLPPLSYVHNLSVAAQRHTEDMAVNEFTGHQGSDGSMPYERLPLYGYEGAYGGEATAWGFEDARLAVEFWVNSPSHRRIILNERAIDLGVGYAVDFKAPNVWYWVAEFGQKDEDEK